MSPAAPLSPPDLAPYDLIALPVLACNAQGHILAVGVATEHALGQPAARLLGSSVLSLLRPQASNAARLPEHLALRQAFDAGVHACVGADGQELSFRVAGHCQGDLAWLLVLHPSAAAQDWRDLQMVSAMAHIGVWRRELAQTTLRYNEQALLMLGLSASDAVMPVDELWKLVHPDDMDALRNARTPLLEGRQTTSDVVARFRHVDGGWRSLLTRRVLQRDAQGKPVAVIGVVIDQTEQLSSTQRELDQYRHLQMATRAAGVAIWTYSPGNHAAQWNEHMYALHGLPADRPAPPLDAYIDTYFHPDERELGRQGMGSLIRRGSGLVRSEMRLLLPDGRTLHVDARTAVTQHKGRTEVFGTLMDVTDRHQAQAQLRAAGERAALVSRAAGIGTFEIDLTTLRSAWDEQMWVLRGQVPRPEPPDFDERLAMVHPDDRQRWRDHHARILADGSGEHFEFRVVWPDGRYRWLALRSAQIADSIGRPLRRIGINWDITDARERDAARQEGLLAQRESRAKSRFLTRMSHELRTPLNAVIGFTQLMLSDDDPHGAAQQRRRLGHIRSASAHLLALINDALDLTSLETGELRLDMTPVALGPLLQQTVPLLEPLARERQVQLRLGAIEGRPMADAMRLRQVIINLLSNAIKYNKVGGDVAVFSHVEAGHTVLCVSDSGPGIAEHQLKHLFEPFNRLGAQGSGIEGTGIGLAIVKNTIERMGGSVRVSSTLGVGSVFELRLPQASAGDDTPDRSGDTMPGTLTMSQLAAITPAPALALRPRPTLRRVLYIEDNEVNTLLLGEMLKQRSDIHLASAADGITGVAMALSGDFDLILLDMQLPDIDGIEVMRRLRAQAPQLRAKVIALSANALKQDIEAALAAGMTEYWTKPLDLDVFMHRLSRLFGPLTPSLTPPPGATRTH